MSILAYEIRQIDTSNYVSYDKAMWYGAVLA